MLDLDTTDANNVKELFTFYDMEIPKYVQIACDNLDKNNNDSKLKFKAVLCRLLVELRESETYINTPLSEVIKDQLFDPVVKACKEYLKEIENV